MSLLCFFALFVLRRLRLFLFSRLFLYRSSGFSVSGPWPWAIGWQPGAGGSCAAGPVAGPWRLGRADSQGALRVGALAQMFFVSGQPRGAFWVPVIDPQHGVII